MGWENKVNISFGVFGLYLLSTKPPTAHKHIHKKKQNNVNTIIIFLLKQFILHQEYYNSINKDKNTSIHDFVELVGFIAETPNSPKN